MFFYPDGRYGMEQLGAVSSCLSRALGLRPYVAVNVERRICLIAFDNGTEVSRPCR